MNSTTLPMSSIFISLISTPPILTSTTMATLAVTNIGKGSSMDSGLQVLSIFTWVTKIFTIFSTAFSVPLYMIVIYTVIKNRKKSPFNSKYFTIYIALGFVDIISYLYYIIKKCPYWDVDFGIFKPYDQPNIYMQILYFCIWWFAFAQYQLTILISFNRFASIVFSHWYQKYWTERVTLVALAIIFTQCACMAAPIFSTKVTVATTFMSFSDGTITRHSGPVFMVSGYGMVYNLAWKIHIYTIIAGCLVIYPIMFWKIKTLKSGSNNSNSKIRSEIRLMYSALVLFLANLLFAAYFVFRDQMISQYQEFGKYSEWTLFLLSDIYDLHNSYALILTSKDVRKAVWRTITMSNEDSTIIGTAAFSHVPPHKIANSSNYTNNNNNNNFMGSVKNGENNTIVI